MSNEDLEEWERTLIDALIREWIAKLGKRVAVVNEARQECTARWSKLRHQYRVLPMMAWKAGLRKVVRRKLVDLHRRMSALKRQGDYFSEKLPENDRYAGRVQPDEEIRIMVNDAIAVLTPLQQQICELLKNGHGPTEIAPALNLTRNQVNYQIKLIRNVFYQQGLKIPEK
ncbi:MAG: ECF-type sigma factor [Bdellovibrionota bacterium]